ncbi:DUF1127 domain-containing protein [Martelella radicis]|uniref:Uncharacterized protein YjiS (DUF1127 family) n=1 Tax=Martelella radicis TaxID=1397476 RepID=A0A7W6P9F5_9HYPH|nr:DUF1127 domain-containing protein [Martelella radicis]MBB4121765.1 uncharacterized protein YjiS (DUF1127 family) [Martelella radicis]
MHEIVIAKPRSLPTKVAAGACNLARLIFIRWPQRRRQRLHLLEMTDERLRDIGIEPHQVRQEASRPFWD